MLASCGGRSATIITQRKPFATRAMSLRTGRSVREGSGLIGDTGDDASHQPMARQTRPAITILRSLAFIIVPRLQPSAMIQVSIREAVDAADRKRVALSEDRLDVFAFDPEAAVRLIGGELSAPAP